MSSLFAALGVAVSGLSAQSQAIGNISDDLSNAQTTGFKTIGTSFENLVTASSATDNSPGGVTAIPQYQNNVQGTIASTSTTTNLAISGQGFFQVKARPRPRPVPTEFTGSDLLYASGRFYAQRRRLYGQQFRLLSGRLGACYQWNGQCGIRQLRKYRFPDYSTIRSRRHGLPLQLICLQVRRVGFTSTASTVEIYDALGQHASHEPDLANIGA